MSKTLNIFHKIQKQPIYIRKAILWSIIAILSLFLLFLWVKKFNQKLKTLPEQGLDKQLNLPYFEEKLKEAIEKSNYYDRKSNKQ